MKKVNISNCPKDYQDGWNDVTALWEKAQKAYEVGDILAANALMDQSPSTVNKLNDSAKKAGLTIEK